MDNISTYKKKGVAGGGGGVELAFQDMQNLIFTSGCVY